jgi:hypothetical protein
VDEVRRVFLQINIFARLTGADGGDGVPVINGGYPYGVDVFVGKNVVHLGGCLRAVTEFFLDDPLSLREFRFPDIANGFYDNVLVELAAIDDAAPPAVAAADEGKDDFFIGTGNTDGGCRGDSGSDGTSGCSFDECAS